MLDPLNHGLEEARAYFSSLLVVATKLSPENTATIMDTLMTTALTLVSTAEDFEVFGFDAHPGFDGGVADCDGREAHEESEDEQHEEGRLNICRSWDG